MLIGLLTPPLYLYCTSVDLHPSNRITGAAAEDVLVTCQTEATKGIHHFMSEESPAFSGGGVVGSSVRAGAWLCDAVGLVGLVEVGLGRSYEANGDGLGLNESDRFQLVVTRWHPHGSMFSSQDQAFRLRRMADQLLVLCHGISSPYQPRSTAW